MKHFPAVLVSIFVALQGHSANADYVLNYGALTCDGSTALIRFSLAPNQDAPVFSDPPDEIDFGLSALPRVDGNICTLSDGREVKVKMADRQAFPYGMCGGRNDASMSLWIGGRKVLSRHPATFSCTGARLGEVIILRGERLTICQSFAAEGGGTFSAAKRFECVDATESLNTAEQDSIEYSSKFEAAPPLGSMTIPIAESDAFCRSFLRNGPRQEALSLSRHEVLMVASAIDAYHQDGAMRVVRSESLRAPGFDVARFQFPELDDEQPEFTAIAESAWQSTPPYWSKAQFDFDNDGEKDTVLINAFRSGGFDGDVIQITGDTEDDALATALLSYEKTATNSSLGPLMEILSSFSITKYSGRFENISPDYFGRHTYQHIFRAGEETLVFAAPIDQRKRPTAIIYRPRPNGAVEPVCVFQRVEENY